MSGRKPRPKAESITSSASTIIAVGPQVASDEDELSAVVGAAARRARPGALPPNSSSTSSASMTASLSDANAGENVTANQQLFEAARQSASMSSSVRAHVYEGGIRYHAFRDGKYPFPNDDVEQSRDDMKHSMTLMLCHEAHFLAPVADRLEAGGEVLDLGTGTGIWVMELGDKYPNSTFIGVDLSPIQPELVPENVHFFVDDFDDDWVDPAHKYDYIHMRHTLYSVRDRNAIYRRAMHHLKPGGYIEFQELEYWPYCDDNTLTPETPFAFRDYLTYMEAGLRAYGSDLHAIRYVASELKEAGFEDVKVITHKAPIGGWPADRRLRLCGIFMKDSCIEGLRGSSRRPLRALGWTQLQIEMFLVDVRKALGSRNIHSYFILRSVYGRKPLS